MTNSIEEILDTDAMFVIGSNTTENHPIIGATMKQAIRNGAKLIVADPRRIELAEYADVFLQLKPGTNIAILNGMMNVILEKGLHDKAYIEERCEELGVNAILSEVWGMGGDGGIDLAEEIIRVIDNNEYKKLKELIKLQKDWQ